MKWKKKSFVYRCSFNFVKISVIFLAPSKACYAGEWMTLLFTVQAVK